MSNCCVTEVICASTTPGSNSAARAGEHFGLGDGIGQMIGRTNKVGPLVFVGIRHREQNAPKTGPSHRVFGRKIRSAEKRLSVGEQKSGQRPAALAGDGADRGLIARIDVRAFVAVHFHGDKILVDDFGDLGVLVTLAVDDVAPVAPHRADIEKNGLVFRFRAGKCRSRPIRASRWAGGPRSAGTGSRNLSNDFQDETTRKILSVAKRWEQALVLKVRNQLRRREHRPHAELLHDVSGAGVARVNAACARQIPRPAGDKNGCGLRQASSRDRRLRCRSRRGNRASPRRDP